MNPFAEISRAIALTAPLQRDPRPALLDPGPDAAHTAESGRLPSPTGDIPFVWLAPKAGRGVAIVYAHGGGTADILPSAPLFEALLRRGFDVVSFDFPGFRGHAAHYSHVDATPCLPAVLAYVRQRRARVGLYGLSMGGHFALHALPTAPWVEAVTLFGPPLSLHVTDADRLRELVGTFHPLAAPILLDAPAGHFARTFFVPVRFAPDAHHILFEDDFVERVNALIMALDPLQAAAAAPAVPTLVLGGSWDAAAPPKDLERLVAALRGPAELSVAAFRNHTTLLYDRKVAELTADWFDKRF